MRSLLRCLGWLAQAGLAVAFILALLGCDKLFGLQHLQAPPPDESKDNGYVCSCTCQSNQATTSVSLNVCAPPGLNPNLDGGVAPTQAQLQADCTDRVRAQVQAMNGKCFMRNSTCACVVSSPLPSTFYDASCNSRGCSPAVLAGDCSNWNPAAGVKTANCANANLCVSPGPVCLAMQADPPEPTPAPLSAGLMGQATRCVVSNGQVTIKAGDQSPSSVMTGVLNFFPEHSGCAAGQTCVGLSYKLDTTQKMSFGGVLGFDTDLENVASIGATTPIGLDALGAGSLPALASQTSGRGTQIETNGPFPDSTSRQALFGQNESPVRVVLDGGACLVQGSLLGSVGDPSGDSSSLEVTVDLPGAVQNTPPHASLGSSRTVECTSPSGAPVTLDASGSTDAEGNIVFYGWFKGSRSGDDLGSGASITVQQPLGAQTYVLKAIDEYMQAGEASATITVADTTGPAVDCHAPATITPSKTPYAFTATATDVCDSGLGSPVVVDSTCFALNSAGKPVARQCAVRLSGSTFTILDSGGIGNILSWRVRSTDAQGNATLRTCTTQIVRP